jgi:hypothetical protein
MLAPLRWKLAATPTLSGKACIRDLRPHEPPRLVFTESVGSRRAS